MVGEKISLGKGIGEFSALIAAFGFSGMTISIRANRENDLLTTILFGSIITTLFSSCIIFFIDENILIKNNDLILSLGMGIFQLGLGIILYTLGAIHLISLELTVLSLTEVIFGPILVWIFIDEIPTKMGLIGGLIILFSIILMALIGFKYKKIEKIIKLFKNLCLTKP